ncbi:MAG: hypothetical protein QG635_17, partial [Bacteroidota bacterium]|nr:hypothetical protein [Bacteroidota bacterium]
PNPLGALVTDLPSSVHVVDGLTTDTSTWIRRKHLLTGSRKDQAHIVLFVKPQNDVWRLLSPVNNTSTNTWEKQLDLPGYDSVYYLAALMETELPNRVEYNYDPDYIFSQAGANIFHIIQSPVIDGDSICAFMAINCPDNVYEDTVWIKNTGTAPLIIDFDKYYFVNATPGLELISPTAQYSVLPGDSVRVAIRYTYQAGQSGSITDTLTFPHNDIDAIKKPWKIAINIIINEIKFEAWDINLIDKLGLPPDKPINLDTVCYGERTNKKFAVRNLSGFNITLELPLSTSDNFSTSILGKEIIPPNDTTTILVEFDGIVPGPGNYSTILKIFSRECDSIYLEIPVNVTVIESIFDFSGSNVINNVKVGESGFITLIIKNDGTAPMNVQPPQPLYPPFSIDNINPSLPRILNAQDSVVLTIKYTPIAEGRDSILLVIYGFPAPYGCGDTLRLWLFGTAVQSKIYIQPDSIDFSAQCIVTKDTSIVVKNAGSLSVTIPQKAVITGTDAANFSISQEPPAPYALPPKTNSPFYFVRFDPKPGAANGEKLAELRVKTNDSDFPELVAKLRGVRDLLDVEIFDLTGNLISKSDTLDLGSVPLGKNKNIKIVLKNKSLRNRDLNFILNSNTNDFTINPSFTTISGNDGSATFTITFEPTAPGITDTKFDFVFGSPCSETYSPLYAMGIGVEGSLDYPTNLDFGILASCMVKTDSIKILNTGASTVRIDSMAITGPDANLFKYANTTIFPVNLDSNQSLIKLIKFDPRSSTDGLKQAELIVYVYSDLQHKELHISLTGIRLDGLLAAPSPVEFGGVVISTSSSKTITLKNESPHIIIIESSDPLVLTGIFGVNTGTFPITIVPGDSVYMTVTFSPQSVQDYTDTLKLHLKIADSCITLKNIALNGNGTPARKILIWANDSTFINPTDMNYRLPIYARIDTSGTDMLSDVTVTYTLSFNPSVFYPYSVTSGSFTTSVNERNYIRIMNVVTDKLNISSNSAVMTEIPGAGLLGNSDYTPLELNIVNWEPKSLINEVNTRNGSLVTKICKAGGER